MVRELRAVEKQERDKSCEKLRNKAWRQLQLTMEKQGLTFDKDNIIREMYAGSLNMAAVLKQPLVVFTFIFVFCFGPLLIVKLFDIFMTCFLLFTLLPILTISRFTKVSYLIWMENRIFIQEYFGKSYLISIDEITKFQMVGHEFGIAYCNKYIKHGIPGYSVLNYLEFLDENRPDLGIKESILQNEACMNLIKKDLSAYFGDMVTRY